MKIFRAESDSTRAVRIDWLPAFAFVALLAGLLVLQRPDLIWHPHVWDGDGTWNIRAFIGYGWGSVSMPVRAAEDGGLMMSLVFENYVQPQ